MADDEAVKESVVGKLVRKRMQAGAGGELEQAGSEGDGGWCMEVLHAGDSIWQALGERMGIQGSADVAVGV